MAEKCLFCLDCRWWWLGFIDDFFEKLFNFKKFFDWKRQNRCERTFSQGTRLKKLQKPILSVQNIQRVTIYISTAATAVKSYFFTLTVAMRLEWLDVSDDCKILLFSTIGGGSWIFLEKNWRRWLNSFRKKSTSGDWIFLRKNRRRWLNSFRKKSAAVAKFF